MSNKITMSSIKSACYLVERDLLIFFPDLLRRIINGSLWTFLTAFVSQYIMTMNGMPDNFGLLVASANIMSWGMFEMRSRVNELISDIKGKRTLDYFLILPMPQWLVFVALAVGAALRSMITAICLLPVIKILFWNKFLFSLIMWPQFFAIFIIGNLFYGFAGLWLVSLSKDMDGISNIWMRIVFPLWLGGGYQFTWYTLKNVSIVAAYCSLLNPLVYAYEGIRGSVLGPKGYIDFWYCFGALFLFTFVIGYFGIKKLMRQLDCF